MALVLNLHRVPGHGSLHLRLQEAELLEEGGELEFGPGGPRGTTETGDRETALVQTPLWCESV